MHKLDSSLLNNTYRIQAPVKFNEDHCNQVKVLSYQTDKVYDIHLKGCDDLLFKSIIDNLECKK